MGAQEVHQLNGYYLVAAGRIIYVRDISGLINTNALNSVFNHFFHAAPYLNLIHSPRHLDSKTFYYYYFFRAHRLRLKF